MPRPHVLKTLAEVRAAPEFGAWLTTAPLMRRRLPRGARTVLVLPPFLAGDTSTAPLRRTLDQLGHRTFTWDQGRNLGPTQAILDGMMERLTTVHAAHGTVDLIGWSLGGIFAREMARAEPDAVGQVITLGTPFQITSVRDSNASPFYAALRHRHASGLEMRVPSYIREPLAMPATSIYTKSDGVVRWHHCLNRELPQAENIQIYSSHFGLGHNPAALTVIADRLANDPRQWKPFRAPSRMGWAYPEPDVFRVPDTVDTETPASQP